MQTRHTISELNALSAKAFVRVVGPVFEHSPWIAEKTALNRPFKSFESLLDGLRATVSNAQRSQQMDLIRAHPDLVGRAAMAGTLTAASTSEQAAAGLDELTPEEISIFQKQNAAYRTKFGFPFIICARLNKKDAIIRGFERRLQNSPTEEIQTALAEIFKIAELRLHDLIKE